jgi:hypothetical protein
LAAEPGRHAGRWRCVVRNAAGEADWAAILRVQSPPSIGGNKGDEVLEEPLVLSLVQGEPVSLPCGKSNKSLGFLLTYQTLAKKV